MNATQMFGDRLRQNLEAKRFKDPLAYTSWFVRIVLDLIRETGVDDVDGALEIAAQLYDDYFVPFDLPGVGPIIERGIERILRPIFLGMVRSALERLGLPEDSARPFAFEPHPVLAAMAQACDDHCGSDTPDFRECPQGGDCGNDDCPHETTAETPTGDGATQQQPPASQQQGQASSEGQTVVGGDQ